MSDDLDHLLADETGNGAQGARYPRYRVTAEDDAGNAVTAVTAPDDGICTGDDLMAMDFPPVRWHLPNVIPEGLTFFVGGPKLGKSWFTHEHALASATGMSFLTEWLNARPVLHFALEDSKRRLQSRTAKLGYGEVRLGNWHHLIRVPPGRPVRFVIADWLDRLPDDSPPPLIIVDTLGRVRSSPPCGSTRPTSPRSGRTPASITPRSPATT